MTGPDHAEALALHAALWGDPFATLDAIDDGTLSPDVFADEDHRATCSAIVAAVVQEETPPTPVAVADHLIAAGTSTEQARAQVVLENTFAAAACRTGGLAHYLHRLAEDRERRDIEARLLILANRLHTPGGPARVAAALDGTEAA